MLSPNEEKAQRSVSFREPVVEREILFQTQLEEMIPEQLKAEDQSYTGRKVFFNPTDTNVLPET